MNCIWEKSDNGYRCKYCGFSVPTNKIKKTCESKKNKEKLPPPLVKRAANLTKAAGRHFSTGMKHCTPEQRMARYEQCQKNECGLFRDMGGGGVCAHDDCGCLLSSNRKFLSKLSWASSSCPEGYWGPIEEKDSENT